MQQIKNYATEVGFAAALGVTMAVIKNKKKTAVIHPLLECTTYLKNSPLGEQVVKLQILGDSKNFEEMLLCCEQFLEIIHKLINNIPPIPTGGQFLANRLSNEIFFHINKMCQFAKESRSNTLIDNLIFCESDVLPLIRKFCDSELHNMLLRQQIT